MTPLVVVILAAMWILVLAPPLLRSRSEGRPSTSVGSFRRQLATLSRATPTPRSAVRPIGRAGAGYPPAVRGSAPRGYAAPVAPRGHEYGYEEWVDDGYAVRRGPARTSGQMVPKRGPGAAVGYSMRSGRAAVKRRRQNVLVALAGAALLTGVVGFAMGNGPFIALNLVFDALLAFYVYLLVQLRRAEEQRAMRYAWSNAA